MLCVWVRDLLAGEKEFTNYSEVYHIILQYQPYIVGSMYEIREKFVNNKKLINFFANLAHGTNSFSGFKLTQMKVFRSCYFYLLKMKKEVGN